MHPGDNDFSRVERGMYEVPLHADGKRYYNQERNMARMRSMKVDENDLSRFSHGRYKNFGACVSSEFYQTNPFFFTREMAPLNLVGMYRGGTAFLIAGGPSFAGVRQKYLRQPGIWTMTINNAVKSFRGNAAIVVDDPHRFTESMWIDPKIQKFVPTSQLESQMWDNRLIQDGKGGWKQLWQPTGIKVGDCPNVVGYRRNEKFLAARYLYEDTINWGNHENLCLCGKGERKERKDANGVREKCSACGKTDQFGGRSVFLVAMRVLFLLGFRNVYLLGVDFEMSDTKKYHFEEGRTTGAIRGNMSTYEKLQKWLGELQPYFLAENFKVYNCNPDSRLKAFPYVDYREAIDKTTGTLGDTGKERTEGLYSKYEEKMVEFSGSVDRGHTVVSTPASPALPPVPGQAQFIPADPNSVKIAEGIPVDLGVDEEQHDSPDQAQ